MNTLNLSCLTSAQGLDAEYLPVLKECVKALKDNLSKHNERHLYYDDKVKPKELGMKIPKEYKKVNCSTGWAAKAVNMLAERSILDGFTFIGEIPEGFEESIARNKLKDSYSDALESMLIDGVGFWAVSKDERGNAVANYYDARTAGGAWDYKHKRLKACLVINNFSRFSGSNSLVPSECILFADDVNIVFTRTERSNWVAKTIANPFGECMAVQMAYKKTNSKPFGRSRISNAVMANIDAMMTERLNMAIQSDIFSMPMKYVVGSSDKQYRSLSEDLQRAYRATFMALTTNDEGGSPLVGMLQAADMTPHIAVMDKLASMMASETSIPSAAFGINGNGYISSDALRAASDDLISLAKKMNKANAETMKEVAIRLIAINSDKSRDELEEFNNAITVSFADPALPSDSIVADSVIKVVSAVPEFAGTKVFWRRLGYSDDEIRQIEKEIGSGKAASLVVEKLFRDESTNTA